MRIVLFEPEIPPNTGNVARLCAAFDVELHLIEPLGFSLEDRYLRRAGLDYWPHVRLQVWPDWPAFAAAVLNAPESGKPASRAVMATTRASLPIQNFPFQPEDSLVFGPETRGLPKRLLAASPHQFRIPIRSMAAGGARSLNLATACGISLYAALARCGLLDRFA